MIAEINLTLMSKRSRADRWESHETMWMNRHNVLYTADTWLSHKDTVVSCRPTSCFSSTPQQTYITGHECLSVRLLAWACVKCASKSVTCAPMLLWAHYCKPVAWMWGYVTHQDLTRSPTLHDGSSWENCGKVSSDIGTGVNSASNTTRCPMVQLGTRTEEAKLMGGPRWEGGTHPGPLAAL